MTGFNLGTASEELDVDTMHDCGEYGCTAMMNEWRAMWLLRDGHQDVWTEGYDKAGPYKHGPYKEEGTRFRFIKSLGFVVSSPRRKWRYESL